MLTKKSAIYLLISILAIIIVYMWLKPNKENEHVMDDHEEEGHMAAMADPYIVKLITEHTNENSYKPADEAKIIKAEGVTIEVNDSLTMFAPKLDESEFNKHARDEEMNYAMSHFSEELLDLMYKDNRGNQENSNNGEQMLTDLGFEKNCSGTDCGLTVKPNAAIIEMLGNKLKANDVVLSVNGKDISELITFDQTKTALFSANPIVINVMSPNKSTHQVSIEHSKKI